MQDHMEVLSVVKVHHILAPQPKNLLPVYVYGQ